MKLICFIRGLWLSFRHMCPISGHEFVEDDDPNIPFNVQVSECSTCGEYSISWHR